MSTENNNTPPPAAPGLREAIEKAQLDTMGTTVAPLTDRILAAVERGAMQLLKDPAALHSNILRHCPGYRLMPDEYVGRLTTAAKERAEAKAQLSASESSNRALIQTVNDTAAERDEARAELAAEVAARTEIEEAVKCLPLPQDVFKLQQERDAHAQAREELAAKVAMAESCLHEIRALMPRDKEGVELPKSVMDMRDDLAAARERVATLEGLLRQADGWISYRQKYHYSNEVVAKMKQQIRAALGREEGK